jgi:hypothetical protein
VYSEVDGAPQRSDVLVFFGATGKLADKKIYPAPPVGPGGGLVSLAAEVGGWREPVTIGGRG